MKLGNNNKTCSFWDSSEMFKQAKVQILNYINNKRNVPVGFKFIFKIASIDVCKAKLLEAFAY